MNSSRSLWTFHWVTRNKKWGGSCGFSTGLPVGICVPCSTRANHLSSHSTSDQVERRPQPVCEGQSGWGSKQRDNMFEWQNQWAKISDELTCNKINFATYNKICPLTLSQSKRKSKAILIFPEEEDTEKIWILTFFCCDNICTSHSVFRDSVTLSAADDVSCFEKCLVRFLS